MRGLKGQHGLPRGLGGCSAFTWPYAGTTLYVFKFCMSSNFDASVSPDTSGLVVSASYYDYDTVLSNTATAWHPPAASDPGPLKDLYWAPHASPPHTHTHRREAAEHVMGMEGARAAFQGVCYYDTADRLAGFRACRLA